MKVTKVAILGAGNGGVTAAADLTDRGFEVSLFEMPAFAGNFEVIRKNGGILLQENTIERNEEKFIPFTNMTTDIEEAISGAEIVMFTTPGFAIEAFTEVLAPVVKEEQIILFNAAAAMGCVRFTRKAKEMGIEKNFKLAEANSLTYATRAFPKDGRVELSLRVKKLFLAGYPKETTAEILPVCQQIYDCFVAGENIWKATLENGNPVVHPGPSLMNAGRIDFSDGEFWLYKEGITKHTVNIVFAIEAEQQAVGRAFGLEIEDARQARVYRGYFSTVDKTYQECFNTSEVFVQIKGPTSCDARYFTEDISTGLVLWSDMGKVAGVPTPNIDSIITLGGSMLQRDFRKEGITLESLGFGGKTVEELIDLV